MSRAIILVHGFLTGPDDWDGMLGHLTGYDEVCVFCQPGHVRADAKCKPDYKLFSEEAVFAALEAELERLFSLHGEVDIIGHSMGGAAAVWAAAHFPVRRLCLLAPAIRFPRPGIFGKHFSYLSRRRMLRRARLPEEHRDNVNEENGKYVDDYVSGVKMLFSRMLPYYSPHTLKVLFAVAKRARREIKHVKCPTAALWGEIDEFVPKVALDELQKGLTTDDLSIVRYGNLGHAMALSASNRFVFRDALAFLAAKPIEDILPENPSEERTVLHRYKLVGGETRTVTLKTGLKITNGEAELIFEKTVDGARV